MSQIPLELTLHDRCFQLVAVDNLSGLKDSPPRVAKRWESTHSSRNDADVVGINNARDVEPGGAGRPFPSRVVHGEDALTHRPVIELVGDLIGLVGENGHVLLEFPLVGKIAAGYPIEKFPQTDQLDLQDIFAPRLGQQAGTFALQVDGDSMKDEGILDGDYVIVERRDTARNGERVVALLANGETTLKTFYKERDRIRLQPANPQFEPIIVKECKIQGAVIGVVRRY